MSKLIGVILINYQDYAAKYLAACFASLKRQKLGNFSYRIYVVDNASSPESLNYLKVSYPDAYIFPRSDGNYAAANNLGIKMALNDGCDRFAIMNMDTELEENCLLEMAQALESDSQIGIVQAKILLYDQAGKNNSQPRLNSLGNLVHFLGFGFTRGYGKREEDFDSFLRSAPYPEIKGYASGCALMIKKEVVDKIQGYNEEYYMYHDDLELSLKARLVGYKIVLAPRALIYHKYEFKRSVKMIYYMERNRYLFIFSFYPWRLIALLFVPLLLMDIGMIFYSLLGGWFKDLAKVYRYYLKAETYRLISQERKNIKSFQTIPFKEVSKDFVGQIDFQEINNPILRYIANPILGLYWRLVKLII